MWWLFHLRGSDIIVALAGSPRFNCEIRSVCVCVGVCFSEAVGGLMGPFIYSFLFEGAPLTQEGHAHQVHMALFNTLLADTHTYAYTHTHTHTTFQPTLLSVSPWELSLLGDCLGWKNKSAETPKESPSSKFNWAFAYLWATGKWIYCQINQNLDFVPLCEPQCPGLHRKAPLKLHN